MRAETSPPARSFDTHPIIMDSNQIADFIQLAKSASPWGAVAIVALGIIRLVRDLQQPRALAAAVKAMDSQQEKDALVELYRLANPPKAGVTGNGKGKPRA